MNVDYNNSLTSLSNSILKYFDSETHHESLEVLDTILHEDNPKNVVLIVCDGMGSKILDFNLNENDFLRKHKVADISSVFPPTTTAATTSLLSGLNPCEHGWLGWDLYVKPEDKVVTLYLNTVKDTNTFLSESITGKYLSYTSIVAAINQKYRAEELYSHVLKRETALEVVLARTRKYCEEDGRKFIYVYYDEPDHSCHLLGYDHSEIVKLYRRINDKLRDFCESLEDTTVIITADHGHITCEPVTLSEYADIFSTLFKDTSIEGRACNFFIKEDKKEEFVSLFNKYFSKDFILLSKEEVLNRHIFGYGNEHPLFRDSLGDFLAIAITNKYFRYNENSVLLKSMHAGSTDLETIVPLILSRKK